MVILHSLVILIREYKILFKMLDKALLLSKKTCILCKKLTKLWQVLELNIVWWKFAHVLLVTQDLNKIKKSQTPFCWDC